MNYWTFYFSPNKFMTIHKNQHPRDDIDRLYVSRKEEARGLVSIEDCRRKKKKKEEIVVDFAVQAAQTVNESKLKVRQIIGTCLRTKKAVEDEGNSDTNCS